MEQSKKPNEQHLERRCRECMGSMKPTSREDEAWNGPGADRGLRFECQQCGADVWFADRSSIAASLLSGLGVLAGLAYAVANDVFGFITYALFNEQTVVSIAIGLGVGVLLLLFLGGSILLLKNAIPMMRVRIAHPLLNEDGVAKSKIWLILSLGLIPWIIAIGFGYINYNFFQLGEGVVIFLLPLLIAPIFFASKFGATWVSVFFASTFWLVLGGALAWLY